MHHRRLAGWFALLLAGLWLAGCGGGGSDPTGGDELNGSLPDKTAFIPPPGTVLTERPVDWTSLHAASSRAIDTALTLGKFSTVGGAPTVATVPLNRLDLYSAQITDTRPDIVWMMTPVATTGAKNKVGDNDLAVSLDSTYISSAHYGAWEEWVAFTPWTVGRCFGLIWAAPDLLPSHTFRVEADLAPVLTVGGSPRTGMEKTPGSDWFKITPPYNPLTGLYAPITVTVTALGGDDPDLYLYDAGYGYGGAPVVMSYEVGSDVATYSSPSGATVYARVRAYGVVAQPCDYMIQATSP